MQVFKLLNKLNLIPFSAPTETLDKGAIEDKTLSKEDTIDFMGEDDDKDPETIELEKDTKKDKEDKPEEDKEGTEEEKEKSLEDELEEELEEPDEDKLALTTPERRKEILAKYPNLFKEFPGLEKAYYREQKYAEILPTIEDAQQAVEKAGLLDSYEQDLLSGSHQSILQAVKDGDAEAFNKIVDNYLPALQRVDEGAYYHIVGNIIKHTIKSMVDDGNASGDEDTKDRFLAAASIVNEYIFGTKTYTPPTRMSKPETKKDDKEAAIEKRELDLLQSNFESHGGALEGRVTNILKSTIDKNIDPRGSMTDYVKGKAIQDAMENLEDIISRDSRFTQILDRLWEKAFNDNFSKGSMDRIEQAYKSKAKTLLLPVIRKARNEALKGMGKRVDDGEERDKKGPLPVSTTRRTTSSSTSSGQKTDKDKAREIPKGVSSRDYLMQD